MLWPPVIPTTMISADELEVDGEFAPEAGLYGAEFLYAFSACWRAVA